MIGEKDNFSEVLVYILLPRMMLNIFNVFKSLSCLPTCKLSVQFFTLSSIELLAAFFLTHLAHIFYFKKI